MLRYPHRPNLSADVELIATGQPVQSITGTRNGLCAKDVR